MAESRWLSRMPVYDIAKGRVVGRIHRLIVDAEGRKVVGLLLATRLGREPRCLPFRHVHSIGEHAVTVRGTEAIAPLSELPDMEEALRAQRRIYNSPILTEGGAFIGDVDEFTINTQSGRLEALLVSGGLIRDLFRGQAALPSHLIVAIGEDATIVKDMAVSFLAQHRKEQEQSTRPQPTPPEASTKADTPKPGSNTEMSWGERLKRVLAIDRRKAAQERTAGSRRTDVTEARRPDAPAPVPVEVLSAPNPVEVRDRPAIHIIRADGREPTDDDVTSVVRHLWDATGAKQKDTDPAADNEREAGVGRSDSNETDDESSKRS